MTDSHHARNPHGSGSNSPYVLPENAPRKQLWIWRVMIFVLPVLVIIGAIAGFSVMGALKPHLKKKKMSSKLFRF